MDQKCILVVEDHPPLLLGITAVLESDNYNVVAATNGVHALELLEGIRPDLIVADIMMPKMDGYALFEAVSNMPGLTAVPFIFLTAKSAREDILKGKALGVEDYITKPFDREELLVTVRARIGRSEAVQAATRAEVDQFKQQIVTALSHELRTPITYMTGYTGVALESIDSLSLEELSTLLSQIKSGADRLTRLVNDLMLLIHVDSGQAAQDFELLATMTKNLDAIVQKVVCGFQQYADANGLKLIMKIPSNLPSVLLAETFFVDALGRLIENAIKFSKGKGKEVAVNAWEEGDSVHVAVTDKGIGIAPDGIPGLFQRFRQIDRKTKEQQGTGLGLAIVWELIRLHGGDVVVESTFGTGSTVSIVLPVAQLTEIERRDGS